ILIAEAARLLVQSPKLAIACPPEQAPFRIEREQRTGRRRLAIRLVLRHQARESRSRITDLDDADCPQHLNPRQLLPVLGVAIHRQRGAGITPEKSHPGQLLRRNPLRLPVDRAPYPAVGEGEGY